MMKENGTIYEKYTDPDLGEVNLIYTFEMHQDLSMYQFFVNMPRNPITEKEVEEWRAGEKQLNEMDWSAAYQRVKIERD